jgi:hypothetical protein
MRIEKRQVAPLSAANLQPFAVQAREFSPAENDIIAARDVEVLTFGTQ